MASALLPGAENNSDNSRIEANSAMVAPPITSLAKSESPWPASFRAGMTIPSDVDTSTIATNKGDSTCPSSLSAMPARRPSTMEIENEPAESRRDEPLSRRRSISRPARKNRKARPMVDRIWIGASTFTHPSPEGPMAMPARISRTTAGRRSLGAKPKRRRAPKATATTISRPESE